MNTLTAALNEVTAGYNADHFLDDEEFNYAINEMEDMGHDREAATKALGEWISQAPMWDCPECGKTLDESYAECPICETANPSVVWIKADN